MSRKGKSKKFPIKRVVAMWVLVLSAWAVGSYPGASMWINDNNLSAGADEYRDHIINNLHNNPTLVQQQLSSADKYNSSLSESFDDNSWELADPWGGQGGSEEISGSDDPRETGEDPYGDSLVFEDEHDPRNNQGSTSPSGTPTTKGYDDYVSHVNLMDEMGILTIPSVDVKLPIYHGTTDESLYRGVGHVYGTHLPVGGVGTHTALAAHSGLKSKTMFDNLPNMKVGDIFYIESSGRVLAYQVFRMDTVRPNETELLQPQVGEDLATLITCVPYRFNTHRLLVTGRRVSFPTPDSSSASGEPGDAPSRSYLVNKTTTLLQDDAPVVDHGESVRDLEKMRDLTGGVYVKPHWWAQAIFFGGLAVVILLGVWTALLVRKYRRV